MGLGQLRCYIFLSQIGLMITKQAALANQSRGYEAKIVDEHMNELTSW